MADKKEDRQTKQYAAFREGCTEAIAIPVYITLNALCTKAAPFFLDKKNVKTKLLALNKDNKKTFDDILKLQSNKKTELKGKEAFEKLNPSEKGLFKDYKSKLALVKTTSSFAGICLSALIFIPAICNLILPHILKRFNEWQDKKYPENKPSLSFKGNVHRNLVSPALKPLKSYPISPYNSGLRIGN